MKFQPLLTSLRHHRASKTALLLLPIALIVCGGLLVGGANQNDKFTIKDATTTADNGKRIVAKPGFQLKVKNQSTGEVMAFKTSKGTKLSSDSVTCVCRTFARCGSGASPCCSHSESARSKESCSVSVPEGGGSADCKGACDQCSWR